MGGLLGNVMGCVGNVIGCVDYSVSGSGAVSEHLGWWGVGGSRFPAVYTPLMTVALPLRLHSLGLEWLHVVQELEVT
jgi:hypothetical protein